MLSDSEISEIKKEVLLYPYSHAACLDALKIVQQQRGWVSDEAVKDIAELLEMSDAEVDNVATFYSRIYRQPVGRNIILICDGMSCMIMGYQSLYDALSKELGIKWGETTSDNRFTLLPISCLGNCDHAPAMMINNDLHNNLSTEKIKDLLASYE